MTKVEEQLKKVYLSLYNKVRAKAENILLDTPTIDHLYRFNKYYEYLNWLSAEMVKLGMKEIKIMSPALIKAYEDNRGIIKDRDQFFTEPTNVDRIWCSDMKRFSDRIWADKERLKERLTEGLTDCITRGATTDALKKDLMKSCGVSYNNATRLVRTEIAAQEVLGTLDKFVADGIDKYKIVVAHDTRTCEDCKKRDGEVYQVAMAKLGENCPPFHPNCRDTILAVIE